MSEPQAALMKLPPLPETTTAVVTEKPAAPRQDATAADESDAILAEGLRVALRVMLARFPGLQETDAQDIAQELAVEFWLHRDTVKSPAGWFRACAVHRAQRFLSRRRFNDTLDSAANAPEPAAAIREHAIQQIFFTMQNRCRRLLGLVVIAGCRPEELAAGSDRTARSVYQNTARCLKTLRSRWLRFSAMQETKGQAAS